VCLEAVTSSNDIFFAAPCGSGKSVCFVIPAVQMGCITLVVEPFKALIELQLQSLILASNKTIVSYFGSWKGCIGRKWVSKQGETGD
jgi:superfamily II DNA helicase RecQ